MKENMNVYKLAIDILDECDSDISDLITDKVIKVISITEVILEKSYYISKTADRVTTKIEKLLSGESMMLNSLGEFQNTPREVDTKITLLHAYLEDIKVLSDLLPENTEKLLKSLLGEN